jgi:hypothetical protein
MTTEDLNQIRQIIREELDATQPKNIELKKRYADLSDKFNSLLATKTKADINNWLNEDELQCAHEWENKLEGFYWQCRKCLQLRDTSPNEQNNGSK